MKYMVKQAKKRVWEKGINITVSRKAHKLMLEKAKKVKSNLTLRGYLNFINDLSVEI